MRIWDALAFVGEGIYKKQSMDELLRRMDVFGVEKSIIAPVEEYVTVDNDEGNRYIHDACKLHPDRFLGYAVANPWYGKRAVESLRFALNSGLRAVYFDSSVQGFTISDDIVNPLIEVCAEFNAPVYFHTGTPAFALPLQVHYLAARFPSVRFMLGHCGANDFVADALPSLHNRDNVWLESSMTLAVTMFSCFSEAPDRYVFGSGSPRSDLEFELMKIRAACDDETKLGKALSLNLAEVLGGAI